MKRAYQITLVAAFCFLCCVPGALMVARPENPNLYGVKPVAYPSFEPSFAWTAEFEQYFIANFGLKRRLVQLHNLLGFRVLGDLQSDNVLVGKDRWLYLNQDAGWVSFRSEHRMSPNAERTWIRNLTAARRFLEEREIPFITIIPPSKETIYPEFLPRSATRANSFTRLDEVLELYDRTGNEVIDLRAPFLAAKKQARLYDRYDSHWNGRGAQIGAELLMQHVADALDRPETYAELDARPIPSDSFVDLLLILALDDVMKERTVSLVANNPRARRIQPDPSIPEHALTRAQMNRLVYEVDDPSLPSALILRDSFSEALTPVLAHKFRRSVWIWTHHLDFSLVDREQPDIVIMEMTERFFASAPARFVSSRARRRR